MSTEEQSIEKLIQQETEKRIEEMEEASYQFPARITGGDVAGIIGSVTICLVLIALCMMGVIV